MPARLRISLIVLLLTGCTRITLTAPDPYPECPAIREWLRTHVSDPSSVEIVEWEERRTYENVDVVANRNNVQVVVRYRNRNEFGALQIKRATFTTKENKVIGFYLDQY